MTFSEMAAAAIVLVVAVLVVGTSYGFVVLGAPLLAHLYDSLLTVYLSIVLSTLLSGVFTGVPERAMHGALWPISVCGAWLGCRWGYW